MKNIDIKYIKAARKYAGALFQTAFEKFKTEKIYNEIVFVTETINTNPQLKEVLENPAVMLSDKQEIISKIFSVHIEKMTLDFLLLLLENGRINCLNSILDCMTELMNKIKNIINPVIISALELNDEQKHRIVSKLENKLDKKVMPDYLIDTDIIGGIIIKIDDKTIDCSIKGRFDNMKKQLTKGNSYGSN